jgi:two-component system, LytTR family, response regulator
MGWSPQIEIRLREIRMMIPEIHVVIADEEAVVRDQLRFLLAEETGVEIVAECANAEQAIVAIKTHKPDLLLLDIDMQGSGSLATLVGIAPEDAPIIIFTSLNGEHAVRAFEARALDFVLKPIDQRRLQAAIERTRAELLKAHDHKLTHRILDLLDEARTGPQTERLVIKTGGRVVFVDTDEIAWVEAAGNYVEVNASSGRYLLREGIGSLSQRLDANQFVRIHRSIIVNVRKIKELQPCNRGEYVVILRDGKQLSCSRGYRAKLQELIATQ